MRITCVVLSLLAVTVVAQDEKKAKTVSKTLTPPGVTCQVPASWKEVKTTSTMRAATWKISHKSENVDVVVYWFGKRGAGGVEANLERWRKQIKTTKDPETQTFDIRKGFKVHMLDARGTYVAPVRPGATERNNKPDSRLVAAVIETAGGPLYIKAIGAASVLDPQDAAFMAWVKSFDAAKSK